MKEVVLSVTCIKVVIREREEMRVLREVVYTVKSRGQKLSLGNTGGGDVQGRESTLHLKRKQRDDK